jgi:hypothetical protein
MGHVPPVTVAVLRGIDPLITFKDGEIYTFGLGPSERQTNPSGESMRTEAMLYVTLAAVAATGEYPEAVREAAGKFIESSCRVLAERYSRGETDEIRFVDPDGNEIFRSGNHVPA